MRGEYHLIAQTAFSLVFEPEPEEVQHLHKTAGFTLFVGLKVAVFSSILLPPFISSFTLLSWA